MHIGALCLISLANYMLWCQMLQMPLNKLKTLRYLCLHNKTQRFHLSLNVIIILTKSKFKDDL